MFKNIYVKKLWSLNPDEFKLITLDEAIEKYKIYIVCVTKYVLRDSTHVYNIKSFQEWLETEI